MASTYSPNLRIELIGDGEQYDSWGDTTNTNLGTVLEDAIAGLVDVSVTSADQALTIVDGGPDQSRNAILSLTTTTSADFNVYAPPVSKLYVIYNASSYIATIYNSTVSGNTTAAGVGVAVPAGRRLFVMTNGTDFSLVTAPASSANVANTVVERDGSGNFAAGTIAAALSGNATTATTLQTARTLSIGGTGKTFDGSANVTWTAQEINANLPGAVVFFAMDIAPTGYLKANGAEISRTTYADLFTAIGTTFGAGDGSTTFLLPDLRGEFIRGWDDGRAVDSGRVFGSEQDDAFQNHGHNVNRDSERAATTINDGGTVGVGTATGSYGTVSTRWRAFNPIANGQGTPRLAAETRPRNVALLACIKF